VAATSLTSFKSSGHSGAVVAGTPSTANATEGNTYTNTGREILVVTADAGGARTLEIFDVNGNVAKTVSIPASKVAVFGPLPVVKFGTTVKFKASNAAVTISVVKLSSAEGFQVNTGG
jgi:hypothetical protein